MTEKNLSTCKQCKTPQWRIQDGTFDGKNKRWRDEHGNLWSGKLCGLCNKDRLKNTMRKKREKVVPVS